MWQPAVHICGSVLWAHNRSEGGFYVNSLYYQAQANFKGVNYIELIHAFVSEPHHLRYVELAIKYYLARWIFRTVHRNSIDALHEQLPVALSVAGRDIF